MLSLSLRNLHSSTEVARERDRNYEIHVRRVEQIATKDSAISEMRHQHNRIADILQKSKDIARKFKNQQDARHRINENTKMLCALIDIKRKPRMLTEWKRKEEETELRKSRSRTPKRRREEEVKEDNFRLVESLLHQSASIRKYRKKLKTEIADYLKRRDHLQKVKPHDLPRTHRNKRFKTQGVQHAAGRHQLVEIPEDSFESTSKRE